MTLRVVTTNQKHLLLCIMLLICLLGVVGCTNTASPDLASIPFEQALSSGKPTLAEFGRGTCIPCKAMKTILDDLSIEYQGRLNVVIVSVDDYRDLTNQYGIMAIPTQIVFDKYGREVTRHIGLWPKEEIIAQLSKMGIK